mmetsp:Transcript_16784/g.42149  ORF Transcript_16784/g.42149 Transcript_16784/m.42149 type:complete len:329 (-) Transcript_16784:558-1544(-)|eukprot:CAMPEP_0113886204 /NCGR_PEP_ID=MMETSP0780_2-20120614/11404_1 /TAXON_ID=652834 /ORGANISM="Palpitomonas bilix" /LENGTH=328 /DNA_ID=CAMNT_0000874351 /DNA_START=148 /DNA_END=1134 /DNA_ORIENTATION=- /assembly_acc=CAM_ASM_000599
MTQLSGLALIVAAVAASIAVFGVHQVTEGHVGVYWRGGALLNEMTDPGYHFIVPLFERYEEVQVTMQTDMVRDIPCGTRGGVMIYFEKIEVVNRLKKDSVLPTIREYGVEYDKTWIFDKIHHEINQFCSSHSLQEVYIDLFEQIDEAIQQELQRSCDKFDTGIDIISVRVSKPNIPEEVRQNYVTMESERTKLLVAQQHQQVVEKVAETERKKAVIEAEQQAEVARINSERDVLLKEKAKEISTIENAMYVDNQKALADAESYSRKAEAEGNSALLTDAYLKKLLITSTANNTKLYFGESIPKMFPFLEEVASKVSPPQQQRKMDKKE